MTVINCWI